MGPSCVLHSPNTYIIALVLAIIIISCISLLQGLSIAMISFYSNNSVKDKRQVKERWELSVDPHSTDALKGSQKEVTFPRSPSEWAGGPGLWVGAQHLLVRVLTDPEYQ